MGYLYAIDQQQYVLNTHSTICIGSSNYMYLLCSSNNLQQQQQPTPAAIQQHSRSIPPRTKYINICHIYYHAKIFWELSWQNYNNPGLETADFNNNNNNSGILDFWSITALLHTYFIAFWDVVMQQAGRSSVSWVLLKKKRLLCLRIYFAVMTGWHYFLLIPFF